MRRPLFYILISMLMSLCMRVYSQGTDKEKIVSIVSNFWEGKKSSKKELTDSYKVETFSVTSKGKTSLYLVYSNKDWVLISPINNKIFAYSMEYGGDKLLRNEAPKAFLELINWYNEQLSNYSSPKQDTENYISDYVEPLIIIDSNRISWGQRGNNFSNSDTIRSYNKFCPKCHPDSISLVGCVAVAMGQTMCYWQWPYAAIVEDDFGNKVLREYDFEMMPYRLTSATDMASVNQVANLLHDVGVAVDMDYGCQESGAYSRLITPALKHTFTYYADTIKYRSQYSNNSWLNLLRNELASGRPILYSGSRLDSVNNRHGHQFLLEGYDDSGKFYVNYGWKGWHNGYYTLDSINNSHTTYHLSQAAIMGVLPNYPECSHTTLSNTDIAQNKFIKIHGGGITISDKTIQSNQEGVILSEDFIHITGETHIQNGARVHFSIRDMHCNGTGHYSKPPKVIFEEQTEHKEDDIVVSPNPTHDLLHIKTQQTVTQIIITELNGKTLIRQNQTKIDFSNLPQGIYIVSIIFETNEIKRYKVIHN